MLKLTVRLTPQFVSVSPFNIRLGQSRSLGLKVWGVTKHISGVSTSVFIIFFNENFSWRNKIWKAQKNFGRIAPEYLRGYRSDSDFPDTSLNRHFLTKQSSSDKRGLTVVTVFSGPQGAQDYKAQYQKLNASCSFSIHKAHRIIRRIKCQTVFNPFPKTPECLSRHWEFNLSLHTRGLICHTCLIRQRLIK